MLITAAGTITAARVFVIGAGVAGLQAIATARRLGAVASAYDMRPGVEGAGAKPRWPIRRAAHRGEGRAGRAAATRARKTKRSTPKQRELLGNVVAESDVVITAAVIPGKKSPILVTREMVARMAPGSVIVDLAAERGGNCELTKPEKRSSAHGVTIIGWINLASRVRITPARCTAAT